MLIFKTSGSVERMMVLLYTLNLCLRLAELLHVQDMLARCISTPPRGLITFPEMGFNTFIYSLLSECSAITMRYSYNLCYFSCCCCLESGREKGRIELFRMRGRKARGPAGRKWEKAEAKSDISLAECIFTAYCSNFCKLLTHTLLMWFVNNVKAAWRFHEREQMEPLISSLLMRDNTQGRDLIV